MRSQDVLNFWCPHKKHVYPYRTSSIIGTGGTYIDGCLNTPKGQIIEEEHSTYYNYTKLAVKIIIIALNS